MLRALEGFLEVISVNATLCVVAFAIFCAAVLGFFWILCKEASESVREFRILIETVFSVLPTEFDNAPGRVNVFMIVLTFLLTIVSMLTQTPESIIANVLKWETHTQHYPLIFFGGTLAAMLLSPLMAFRWTRIKGE